LSPLPSAVASAYEPALRAELSRRPLSASHGFAHLDQVLRYALALQVTYGGDVDVITAAVLLHDLGRSNTKVAGVASAQLSAELAPAVLDACGFPQALVANVLQAIREHDQPALRPTMLEGRILKDADFLAGFGAMGIVRSALWTGESGGTLDALIERLTIKMPARIASLEFEQSRLHAVREYGFVNLFLEQLHAVRMLQPLPASPYIVLEGISGSGKSTQIDRLRQRFALQGREAIKLHEPTPWFMNLRTTIDPQQWDKTTQLLLLLADRQLQVRPVIERAAAHHQPILADRSYLSTLVYQAGEGWSSAGNIAWMHQFLPQPTHIFVLDLDAETAMERIQARYAQQSEQQPHQQPQSRGDHESLALLTKHRAGYLGLKQYFPHVVVIDVKNLTTEQLTDQIWSAVEPQR